VPQASDSDIVSSTAPIEQPHAPAAGEPTTRAPEPAPRAAASASSTPLPPASTPSDTQPSAAERARATMPDAALDAERIPSEPTRSARAPFAAANRRPRTTDKVRHADAVGDHMPKADRDATPKPAPREPSRPRQAAPIGAGERDVTVAARAAAAVPAAPGTTLDRRTPLTKSPGADVPQPPQPLAPPSGAPISAAPPPDTARSPVDDAAADARLAPRPASARQIASRTPTDIDAVVPSGPTSVAARARPTGDPNRVDRDAPVREMPAPLVDQHRPPGPAGSTPHEATAEGPRRALPEVSAPHGRRTTQPMGSPAAHRSRATSGSAAVADPPSRPTSDIAQPNGRVADGDPIATPLQMAPLPPTRTTRSAVDLGHAAPRGALPPVVPTSAAGADASDLRPRRREPPPVKISIGRVTVAAPAAPTAPPVRRTQPSLSLRDYLSRRRGPP
jgi:hypothetical protein